MYKISYTKKAEKFIRKLPHQDQTRVLKSIERSQIRPYKYFERLVGEKTYKLRVGDFRIIADIIDGDLLILVVQVGHRKNIYKK